MDRIDFIILAKKVLIGVIIFVIPLLIIGGGLLILRRIL